MLMKLRWEGVFWVERSLINLLAWRTVAISQIIVSLLDLYDFLCVKYF